ncbi:MAG: hypothetical protein WAN48_12435 [Actinomycetes bacterium]
MIPLRDDSRAWAYLRAGVPITLLCDLLYRDGPPSRDFLVSETLADDVARAHPAGRSTSPSNESMPGA